MFNFFKKKPTAVEEPSPQKSEKELATEKGEPWVQVLQLELDKDNPSQGAFELDWNSHFIAQLLKNGYQGKSDEQLVDQWFQDICRHVVLETYEQYQANDTLKIDKRDIGSGRSEFS